MQEGFSSGFGRFAIGPGRLLVDLADHSISTLLGHDVEVVFGRSTARLRPIAVRLDPTPLAMATGRMNRVDVELEDVRWSEGRIDRLALRAHGVHVTTSISPQIVSSPVDVHATLTQRTLDDWLGHFGVEWGIRLAGDGWVEVTMRGREHWGHAVVSASARDRRLRLTPEELVVRGRRVRRPVQRYAKPITIDLPRLPGDARIVKATPRTGELEITARVDEIREPVSVDQVIQMRKILQRYAGGTLVLPRVGF